MRCVNSAPATVLNTLRPIATLFFKMLVFKRRLAPHVVLNVLVIVATMALVVKKGALLGGDGVQLERANEWDQVLCLYPYGCGFSAVGGRLVR